MMLKNQEEVKIAAKALGKELQTALEENTKELRSQIEGLELDETIDDAKEYLGAKTEAVLAELSIRKEAADARLKSAKEQMELKRTVREEAKNAKK